MSNISINIRSKCGLHSEFCFMGNRHTFIFMKNPDEIFFRKLGVILVLYFHLNIKQHRTVVRNLKYMYTFSASLNSQLKNKL